MKMDINTISEKLRVLELSCDSASAGMVDMKEAVEEFNNAVARMLRLLDKLAAHPGMAMVKQVSEERLAELIAQETNRSEESPPAPPASASS